jgi:hypothetical protein
MLCYMQTFKNKINNTTVLASQTPSSPKYHNPSNFGVTKLHQNYKQLTATTNAGLEKNGKNNTENSGNVPLTNYIKSRPGKIHAKANKRLAGKRPIAAPLLQSPQIPNCPKFKTTSTRCNPNQVRAFSSHLPQTLAPKAIKAAPHRPLRTHRQASANPYPHPPNHNHTH